jgi:flagellar biosynthesis protein FlhF
MPVRPAIARAAAARREPPVLRDPAPEMDFTSMASSTSAAPMSMAGAPMLAESSLRDARDAREVQQPVLDELRSMRGLIEQRFGALAFMEKLQRQPRQATLSQRLMDFGFSPQLVRKLVEGLPDDVEEMAWAGGVLEHNLITAEHDPALEDQGGVYALIGSTGVGKTTTTAKLAAAFATRHGASNLGLVTLDAYRVAAHEQLRTYGRILGVPVHTAHDRASLEDLLDLLSAKKMVLIDTAGMAQRDARTRELLDMLSHRSVNRLLVVNAAQQGETIEDVLVSYRAASCKGVILSKIDEAVKLGPAVDALIRHRLKVLGVANGQRVPEDWHRLSAHALVQRALRGGGSPAWKLDAGEVNLVFAGLPARAATSVSGAAASAAPTTASALI